VNYAVSEVSRMLDVCPSTVRNWISSGKLKGVKREGFIMMIDGHSLEKFLADNPKYINERNYTYESRRH